MGPARHPSFACRSSAGASWRTRCAEPRCCRRFAPAPALGAGSGSRESPCLPSVARSSRGAARLPLALGPEPGMGREGDVRPLGPPWPLSDTGKDHPWEGCSLLLAPLCPKFGVERPPRAGSEGRAGLVPPQRAVLGEGRPSRRQPPSSGLSPAASPATSPVRGVSAGTPQREGAGVATSQSELGSI